MDLIILYQIFIICINLSFQRFSYPWHYFYFYFLFASLEVCWSAHIKVSIFHVQLQDLGAEYPVIGKFSCNGKYLVHLVDSRCFKIISVSKSHVTAGLCKRASKSLVPLVLPSGFSSHFIHCCLHLQGCRRHWQCPLAANIPQVSPLMHLSLRKQHHSKVNINRYTLQ